MFRFESKSSCYHFTQCFSLPLFFTYYVFFSLFFLFIEVVTDLMRSGMESVALMDHTGTRINRLINKKKCSHFSFFFWVHLVCQRTHQRQSMFVNELKLPSNIFNFKNENLILFFFCFIRAPFYKMFVSCFVEKCSK